MQSFIFSNNPSVALFADSHSDIHTLFIDLEILGKEDRQRNTNSLISYHTLSDISLIRNTLHNTSLGVRVNPLNPSSAAEVEACLDRGADVLMLPMFTSVDDVNLFVEIVGGRCEIDLLFETPLSLASIQEYPFEYIRSIHFGINDLSLALNEIHMFSVYFNIHFREACSFLASKRYSFGIGGIGSVNARPYSPTMIIASSLLLGSSCFILSRNF